MLTVPTRHPNVPQRRTALGERQKKVQLKRGIYTVERGESFAIPVDKLSEPTVFLNREMWRWHPVEGVHRPGVQFQAPRSNVQRKALTWLRDHVSEKIPYLYYMAVLGHDVHVSTWGELYGEHWHKGWADPFSGMMEPAPTRDFQTLHDTHWVRHECDLPVCPSTWGSWDKVKAQLQGARGFTENLGFLSGAKVTDAFVSEEIDELVSTSGTEYADFDSHEVGTDNTAEDNDHTALQATTGIARAAGTPTDSDPIYQSVASITADATESFEEHGLFNNTSGASMMDRNLTGGQSVTSSDVVQYTYQLTKAPEA